MTNNITLTASMRSNLSSLKSLASQMSTTQTRLATGKKVNSAIDNANSYYQSRALTNRASDLDSLLDSMGQGIQTITAASETIEAGLTMIEQMQSVASGAAAINDDSCLQIDAFFNGRANTKAIVDQLGEKGLAAYATTQFYAPGVSADDENFGQGKWYLPSIGELMDAYGNYESSYYKYDTEWNEIEISRDEYEQLSNEGYYLKTEFNYESGDKNTSITTAEEYEQFITEYGSDWVETEDGEVYIESGLYLDSSFTNDDNKQAINTTLSLLASQGADASTLTNSYYWSSSESSINTSWVLNMSNGTRGDYYKGSNNYVRAFQLLENCFTPLSLSAAGGSDANHPQVGDVMYSDLSWSKASEYDGSKVAVGVITWLSDDGASARIMSLKNLTFSSGYTVNNFDPEHPYNGSLITTAWATFDKWEEDISGIQNIDYREVSTLYEFSSSGTPQSTADFSDYQQQFNAIYQQYDNLIKDANYQGTNLLNGGNLNVMFNETRTHVHQVNGYHADAQSLGIDSAAWQSVSDVKATITQLQNATTQLRNIAEALGNHLSIIETRQDFTDNLIDVLQTGADDLVLADMNEESANYLALQTRQQLAVNALSLASQANNAVLQLF